MDHISKQTNAHFKSDCFFLKIFIFDLFSLSEKLKNASVNSFLRIFCCKSISAVLTIQKHPTKLLKICGCVASLVEILHIVGLPLRINSSAV